MEILIGAMGVVLGGLISWIITHIYHRRSRADVPDWARSLIERLPDSPCSLDQLMELYRDSVPVAALEGVCGPGRNRPLAVHAEAEGKS